MGCRCRDIGRCSHDIGIVEEISGVCQKASKTDGIVSDELIALSAKCFTTFFCKDMMGLEAEEKNLNTDLTKLLSDFVDSCKYKLESLKEELESMNAEDTEYHEEQERHSHHDDDD